MNEAVAKPYRFDGWEVYPDRQQVIRAGEVLDLEPKAFRTLAYLIEHRDRVVGKEELLGAVWPGVAVTDNALSQAVAQLRRALGDSARQPRYIETVPRVGFRFVGIQERADNPPPPEQPESPSTPFPRKRSSALTYGFAAALAVALVAGLAFQWSRPPRLTGRLMQFTFSDGLEATPAFSPDGRFLAYASDRSGQFQIYVRQVLLDSQDVQITHDLGQNIQPTWSPDGRYLAFYSMSRGGIWIVPALGGPARQIAAFGSHPSWSPDGQRVAFRDGGLFALSPQGIAPPPGTALWLARVDGQAPERLTHPNEPLGGHDAPAWSPDGKRLVFTAHQTLGASEIWMLALDSRRLSRVHKQDRLFVNPIFAPDGRSLYFAATKLANACSIWKLPLTGFTRSPEEVEATGLATVRDLAISPDGRTLAYTLTATQSDLWSLPLTNATPGKPRQLTKQRSFRLLMPVFSPDGTMIAYGFRRHGVANDVWVVQADGSGATFLGTSTQAAFGTRWLPDGKTVLYRSDTAGKPMLVALSLETRMTRQLAELPAHAGVFDVSPDGRAIVFQQDARDTSRLWSRPLTGGVAAPLTPDSDNISYPRWSPDGNWIAAERIRGEQTDLVLVPAQGGAPQPLVAEAGQSWPFGWSPDSDKVVYAGMRQGVWNLYWVSRTTGERRQLTKLSAASSYVRYPAWSPRDDQIVFEQSTTTGNVFLKQLR